MPRLPARWVFLARFYGVGIINTLFGYSLFFGLIAGGINIYVAQAIAHVCGMTFNYIMFRRHVFTDTAPAVGRYLISYGANYLLGLLLITIFALFLHSQLLVGICAALTGSIINFAVLKLFVFNRPVTSA